MSLKVKNQKEVALVSLDTATEVNIARELSRLGYSIKRIAPERLTESKELTKHVDLIIAIPLKTFNDSEYHSFVSAVAKASAIIPTIVTSRSGSIKERLRAYQCGIDAVLDNNFIQHNIQATIESALTKHTDTCYRALLISDSENFQKDELAVLAENNVELSFISELEKLDCTISETDFDLIIFRISDNSCVCEYLRVLKEIEQFKHISLIVISNDDKCSTEGTCLSKHSDACLSYPVDPKMMLEVSISLAKKARTLKLSNLQFNKHYHEREREHQALDKHALVSVTDVKGTITYVNDLFCQTSGYDAETLIGNNHRVIKSTYHEPEFYRDMWLTISEGNTWQGEICNLNKSGEEYWVESTITAFLDVDGKPYQYVAIRTEVTEQKKIQRELEHTLDILEKTNEAAKIGFWEYDREHDELKWSQQTKVIHEVDRDYQPNVTSALDFYVDGPYRKSIEDNFQRLSEELTPFDQEFVIESALGNKRWVRVIGIPDNSARVSHRVYGLFQDITEKKEVLLDLLVAKEEAESASLAKTRFLAQMSHELRTPLNAILGFSQLLVQSEGLSPDQQEDASEIISAGRHLLKLVNEVLDLSAIEAGRISFSFEPVCLNDLVQECMQLLTPLSDEYGVKITSNISTNLYVKADRGRLKQVVINLLSNAIKYNKKAGFAEVRAEGDEKGSVLLEVENSGLPIPRGKAREIFRPFSRLETNGSSIEGSGVGLSVCKHLISLMGGGIGLRENVSDRNVFWVKLPRDYPHHELESVNECEFEEDTLLPNFRPRKILYVEDNPANLKLVSSILSSRKGVNFFTAHSPEIGLEVAQDNDLDLVLLDINLPGMNGIELMKKLREIDGYRDKPFLAISANAMPEDIENASASGFSGYVTKPINVSEFNELVDQHLV